MKTIQNNRLIKALWRQPVDKTPVWIMRQAGRYLPEYRAVRNQVKDFLTLCKTPELACEVTLQPLRRFPLDAAIVFSDILTLPDAMGLGLHFVEGEGPRFKKSLQSINDIKSLKRPDVFQDLGYTFETIRLLSRSLSGSVPLIGFAGSPWTLACYMLEGGSSKTFCKPRAFVYQAPHDLHQLLSLLTHCVVDYLSGQAEAGADVLMLFDTWGGLLTHSHYPVFSLQYMVNIVHALKQQSSTQHLPIILFTKNGGAWLEIMADSGCDAIGLDWTVNLKEARQRVGEKTAIQGNFDPALLFASPDTIRETVKASLAQYGSGTGHVANLGHGIEPSTPLENVSVLVEAIHEYSKPYHTPSTDKY